MRVCVCDVCECVCVCMRACVEFSCVCVYVCVCSVHCSSCWRWSTLTVGRAGGASVVPAFAWSVELYTDNFVATSCCSLSNLAGTIVSAHAHDTQSVQMHPRANMTHTSMYTTQNTQHMHSSYVRHALLFLAPVPRHRSAQPTRWRRLPPPREAAV